MPPLAGSFIHPPSIRAACNGCPVHVVDVFLLDAKGPNRAPVHHIWIVGSQSHTSSSIISAVIGQARLWQVCLSPATNSYPTTKGVHYPIKQTPGIVGHIFLIFLRLGVRDQKMEYECSRVLDFFSLASR